MHNIIQIYFVKTFHYFVGQSGGVENDVNEVNLYDVNIFGWFPIDFTIWFYNLWAEKKLPKMIFTMDVDGGGGGGMN